MKFLANFDTSLDTKLLQEAEEETDISKILLVKKHPVFLVQGLLWYVSLILLTALFARIILQVDKENNVFEYVMIITVIVVMLYWMTLVAWRYYKYSFFFHTNINAPLDIGTLHTKKFDAFITHSLVVGISYVLCFIVFEIEKSLRGYENQLWISLVGGLCIFFILCCVYKLLFLHIRYELNLLLITPTHIEHVIQRSFFSRKHTTIKARQIRKIDLSQDGLLHGIFNLGTATIITDALDTEKNTYLNFDHIGNANMVKKEMIRILKK